MPRGGEGICVVCGVRRRGHCVHCVFFVGYDAVHISLTHASSSPSWRLSCLHTMFDVGHLLGHFSGDGRGAVASHRIRQ